MASTKRPKTSENPPPTISTTTTTTGNETPSSSPTLSVDLLKEILVRLPVRSLIRFKSVSKQWLSLISDPHFCSRRTSQTPPFHSPASGLSLVGPNSIFDSKDYEFVNLCKLSCPSLRNLSSDLDSSRKYGIFQSCNGLFLLVSNSIISPYSGINYCVYNPTTKSCTVLPSPPPVPSGTEQFSLDYNLAFDPAKSPHYRVVCVRRCNQEDSFNFRIQIYESKTASWWFYSGFSSETFSIDFGRGIFWNGSIHWVGSSKGLYFNVDEAYVREIPMLEGSTNWIDMQFVYFGVSGDHLHLVGVSWPKFNVYEMKRDYSGWFVKFRVDLEEVPIQFPEMIQKTILPQNNFANYACRVICVVRGELDDESYLVLHIPGKIVRYYLKTKASEVLKNLNYSYYIGSVRWSYVYQFIESLACV